MFSVLINAVVIAPDKAEPSGRISITSPGKACGIAIAIAPFNSPAAIAPRTSRVSNISYLKADPVDSLDPVSHEILIKE